MRTSSPPLVSWLGSIYSQSDPDQLSVSIESIRNQTFSCTYEIVLVIDGVIPASLQERVQQYMYNDDDIFFKVLPFNMGLGLALNFGLDACNGKYLARFDTDDINHCMRLSMQIPFLEERPHIAVLASSVIEFSPLSDNLLSTKLKHSVKPSFCNRDLDFKNTLNHPTVVARASILKRFKYFDCKYFEDYLLWLRLRKENYIFATLDAPLVFMRTPVDFSRRWGIFYFIAEFKFILLVFAKRLIPLNFLPLHFLRLLTRLVPFSGFQIMIRRRRGKNISYSKKKLEAGLYDF